MINEMSKANFCINYYNLIIKIDKTNVKKII